MEKQFIFTITLSTCIVSLFSQAPNFDLIMCKSSDGVNWTNNIIFESNAGVPSAAQHATGVISCVFQWFPAPNTPSNTAFDRIAVKQSSDGGITWTPPQTINIAGYPSGYKRPFDPTIVPTENGNLRLYFSASKNGMLTLLDSTVHTYSAISPDGINYTYEGVRVLVKDSITIDPAVAKLGSTWHYTSPRAAPQAGAHHFISADGLAWTRTTTITSDMNHNWTGNFLIDGNEMKFYGTPNPQTNAIWMRQTNNGYNWGPYVNCAGPITTSGIQADPTVVKLGINNYIMIYVGKQNLLALDELKHGGVTISCFPNPGSGEITINCTSKINKLRIFDQAGQIHFESSENKTKINPLLAKGLYILEIETNNGKASQKLLIE